MLSATISFSNDIPIETLLISHDIIKNYKGNYVVKSNDHKELATISIKDDDNKIVFTFSGNLKFVGYEAIHNSLISIASHDSSAEINDEKSMLGYLENGEPAYIVTKWNEWTYFLNKAKHKTLEGQKVRVIDESGEEIANGMLVEYKVDPSAPIFIITECTLVTTFGERKFSGKKLVLEPTSQW